MTTAKLGPRVRDRLESTIRVQQRRIEALERALHKELMETIDELPYEASLLIGSGYPESEEDLRNWERDLAEKVLDLAGPKQGEDMNNRWYNGERAICPLCGGSAAAIMQPENTGFAFPEGLRMHLRGARNAKKCRIMTVGARLAKRHCGVRNWWE